MDNELRQANPDLRDRRPLHALTALEEARRGVVRLVRANVPVDDRELDLLIQTGEEIVSIGQAMRQCGMGLYGEVPTDDEEYLRLAIESTVEALRRGESHTARRRAQIARRVAEGAGEQHAVSLLTVLQELIARPESPLDPAREG